VQLAMQISKNDSTAVMSCLTIKICMENSK